MFLVKLINGNVLRRNSMWLKMKDIIEFINEYNDSKVIIQN